MSSTARCFVVVGITMGRKDRIGRERTMLERTEGDDDDDRR